MNAVELLAGVVCLILAGGLVWVWLPYVRQRPPKHEPSPAEFGRARRAEVRWRESEDWDWPEKEDST